MKILRSVAEPSASTGTRRVQFFRVPGQSHMRPVIYHGIDVSMFDLIFVLGAIAFFAISIGYTVLCDRL